MLPCMPPWVPRMFGQVAAQAPALQMELAIDIQVALLADAVDEFLGVSCQD